MSSIKTILITGASTGIGAATALEFAAPQTHLILHYRQSLGAVKEVAAQAEKAGSLISLVQADLASEAGCTSLLQQVAEKTEHLDALINNAGGIISRQPSDNLQWELMEQIFALNVFSAMKVASLSIPLLRKGTNPSMVMLTSIAMRHGAPTAVIYGAAKGALDSLTRGMAKELAPDIRVNAVAPGVIDTPFHEGKSTPEQFEAWKQATPLKKIGVASDISSVIRTLVENTFMTGETIDVNGGLFMR